MRLQLKPEILVKENGIEAPHVSFKFNQLTPAIYSALCTLKEGCEEEEMTAPIKTDEELIFFYYYLNQLKKNGFIIFQTPLIELSPFNGSFSYEKNGKGAFKLSRFTLCRPKDGDFVIETPLNPVRVRFLTEAGLHFFYAFCTPHTLEEVFERFPHLEEDSLRETFFLLTSAGILTNESETTAVSQWEFHDLYFHSRSRRGRQDTPFGGTFRFREKISSLPGVKPCSRKKVVDLPKPLKMLPYTLEEVIGKRKSIRQHGEKPITIKQLGEFLYRTAHVKELFTFGGEELTVRPYPGGGARYELELYPVVHRCEGLEQGVYHYHPLDHTLCSVSERAEEFLRDAQIASRKEEYPQIVIVIGARFQRVSWKYESMAYALILKNVGVLIQTMYLVATAMDLAPCALGGGNADLFSEVMETNYLEESSVGEFMLGSLVQ